MTGGTVGARGAEPAVGARFTVVTASREASSAGGKGCKG